MTMYVGDYKVGASVFISWSTNNRDGSSVSYIGGTIKVYRGREIGTENTAGIGLRKDWTSIGLHNFRVFTYEDTDFYHAGHDYTVVIIDAEIDGELVSAVIGMFSLENRSKSLTEIAGAVWDEVISKATHNVAQSAAKRLRQVENVFITHEGTARGDGGGNDTIQLAADASAINDWYVNDWIILVEGTGIGQMEHIQTYDGDTKIIVTGHDWLINPDDSTDYIIVGRSLVHVHEIETDGLDQIVAAMKAMTGITEGETWTWAKIMKIMTAWTAGNWRVKATDSTVQQLMDAENGTTVILEQSLTRSPVAGSDYRTISVLI